MNKLPEPNGTSRGLYLQWEGKKVYRQQVPTPRLFDPVEKYSHGENRDNLLIEGDNLQVLASLKPRYAGMIDVIYIDLPTTWERMILDTATGAFMTRMPTTAMPYTCPMKMVVGTPSG